MWSPKHRLRLGDGGVTDGCDRRMTGKPAMSKDPAMLPCWTFDLLLEAAIRSVRVECHPLLQSQTAHTSVGKENGICRCLGRCLPLPTNYLLFLTMLKCRKDQSPSWDKKVFECHYLASTKWHRIVFRCHSGPIVLVLVKAAEDQNHLLKLKG